MSLDPKDNPQVGDEVKNKKGRVRRVLKRDGSYVTWCDPASRKKAPHECWITTWRAWAAS